MNKHSGNERRSTSFDIVYWPAAGHSRLIHPIRIRIDAYTFALLPQADLANRLTYTPRTLLDGDGPAFARLLDRFDHHLYADAPAWER